MEDYVQRLRKQVGHEPIFLNAASAIITNESGQVLLQRRGRGEKANAWTFPGGIMEIGETPQQSVTREVQEETGLAIEVEKFVGVYTSPELVTYPNGDVCQMVTQIFICRVIAGTLQADGDETLELKYFSKEDRPQMFRAHLERAMQDFEAGRFGVSN